MKQILFVYGTLMKGHCNDHYLREQKYLGIGKLKNYEMYHVDVYPGIIMNQGDSVVGELYEIDDDVLKTLDIVENEGTLFRREQLNIVLDCNELEAHVYVWNKAVNVKMQKVTEMPWQPDENEPCRCHFQKLTDENPLENARWPIILKTESGDFFETCTIRGAVAAVLGGDYLDNPRKKDDWQKRLKYGMDEIMAKQENQHVVIHDQVKGVVAENCTFMDEVELCDIQKETEFVHIETERAFLFSLVRLEKIKLYQRKNETYFKDWSDDGNDPTVARIMDNGEYEDLQTFDLEELTKQTWKEL